MYSIGTNIITVNAVRVVVLVNTIFLHISTETSVAVCVDFFCNPSSSVDSSLGI